MRTVIKIFLPVLAFAFLTGFDEGRVVIRVNDEPITMGVLYQRIRSQSGENVDKAATQRAVDSLIANHIVTQEAKTLGIPDVTEQEFRAAFPRSAMMLPNLSDRAFQEDWVAAAMRARLVQKLMPSLPVPHKELLARFEELRPSLQAEQADVRWIVVANQEGADRVVARLKAGEDFGVVAKETTLIENVTVEQARVAATVAADKIHPELSKVVFAPSSKAGILLPPVKVEKNVPFYGPKGYYIVEIARMVRTGETTLEQWRPLIESTIRQEKAEKRVEALIPQRRKQAKIWVEKNLAAIVLDVREEEKKKILGAVQVPAGNQVHQAAPEPIAKDGTK
jgi:foldase protein PrsA